MELSREDIDRLLSAGHLEHEFSTLGKDGIPRLQNRGRWCTFYDRSNKRCRVYKIRPLGCSIYPVNVSETGSLVIDDLCPMGSSINEDELRERGKDLISLLGTIDKEADVRIGMEGDKVDRESKMADIRAHFASEASGYDARIRRIIPGYEDMLDAVVSSFPRPKGKKLRAIDLGCGTGALSDRLLNAGMDIEITCLDMTENMLDVARARLADHDNARYVLADMHDLELDGGYDIVLSSLAMHHMVTDEEKKTLYRKIFDGLKEGGAMFVADIVLASDDVMQKNYMDRWKAFMLLGMTEAEVEKVFETYRNEDSPAPLVDHIGWLKEIGFKGVDVPWKRYNFAVFGGKK